MPIAQRLSRQIRPCRAPLRLIVNGQLGNKAYRLDHSLQTHFSRAARAAEQPALRRDADMASSSPRSRWLAGSRALALESATLSGRLATSNIAPPERRQAEFGVAHATKDSPTTAALRCASLRGCAAASSRAFGRA